MLDPAECLTFLQIVPKKREGDMFNKWHVETGKRARNEGRGGGGGKKDGKSIKSIGICSYIRKLIIEYERVSMVCDALANAQAQHYLAKAKRKKKETVNTNKNKQHQWKNAVTL